MKQNNLKIQHTSCKQNHISKLTATLFIKSHQQGEKESFSLQHYFDIRSSYEKCTFRCLSFALSLRPKLISFIERHTSSARHFLSFWKSFQKAQYISSFRAVLCGTVCNALASNSYCCCYILIRDGCMLLKINQNWLQRLH